MVLHIIVMIFFYEFRCYLSNCDLICVLTFQAELQSRVKQCVPRATAHANDCMGDNGQTTGINFMKLGVITTFRFQASSVKVVK